MNYFPDLISLLKAAKELIGTFRNNPEQVTNNARQVDPIIHDLRVYIAELEEKGELR